MKIKYVPAIMLMITSGPALAQSNDNDTMRDLTSRIVSSIKGDTPSAQKQVSESKEKADIVDNLNAADAASEIDDNVDSAQANPTAMDNKSDEEDSSSAVEMATEQPAAAKPTMEVLGSRAEPIDMDKALSYSTTVMVTEKTGAINEPIENGVVTADKTTSTQEPVATNSAIDRPANNQAQQKATADTPIKDATKEPTIEITEDQDKRYHVVGRGENLASIAQKYYGNSLDYRRIFEANRDKLRNEDLVRAGMKLWIPEK